MTVRYYFEDFADTARVKLGERVVTEDEILRFARDYDPQPFHVDANAARDSIYGGLIASGWHTCAMMMRMMCDAYLLDAASLGSPGIEKLEWLRPVRPGDRLTAYRRTLESRPSNSKPDRGVILSEFEVENQQGEVVLRMRGYGMFKRRPA